MLPLLFVGVSVIDVVSVAGIVQPAIRGKVSEDEHHGDYSTTAWVWFNGI